MVADLDSQVMVELMQWLRLVVCDDHNALVKYQNEEGKYSERKALSNKDDEDSLAEDADEDLGETIRTKGLQP